MKKILLILCFGMLVSTLSAQVKPVYFIGDSLTKDSTKATLYGVFGKLDAENLYVLKVYDFYDNLISSGTFKDDSLKVPHGKFSYYDSVYEFNEENGTYYYLKDKDRFLSEQGSFNNGFKTGRWISFYPDGKFFTIVNYVNGLKQGEYKKFDRKGRTLVEGQYLLDLEDGTWKFGKYKLVNFVEGRVRSATN